MDHAKLFGRRLKILRKARNLNQAELAEKVGIETKYLSNIETGRRSPSFDRDRPTALVRHVAGMLLPGAPGNQD